MGLHVNTMNVELRAQAGATTANTKRYIDFAAANGLGGVLVEGWNVRVGWRLDQERNAFSFTQPYPDYDLPDSPPTRTEGCELLLTTRNLGRV